MLPLIALLLIGIPIIEIAVLIEVGGAIGVWNTVGLVILTAVAGTALLRYQGLATLARVQDSLAHDTFPAGALFDGACLLVAGALLLTPGFVTDTAGLLLFFPPFRALLRRMIWRHLGRGKTRIWVDGTEVHPEGERTIEGEWREIEDRDDRDRRGGGGGPGKGGQR